MQQEHLNVTAAAGMSVSILGEKVVILAKQRHLKA